MAKTYSGPRKGRVKAYSRQDSSTVVRRVIVESNHSAPFHFKSFLASERAQSCSCSIEISDTYYVYVVVHQVIRACSVVCHVGGVKC